MGAGKEADMAESKAEHKAPAGTEADKARAPACRAVAEAEERLQPQAL